MALFDKISRALGFGPDSPSVGANVVPAILPVADPDLVFDWLSGVQLTSKGQTIGVVAGNSLLGTVTVPDDGFYEAVASITITPVNQGTIYRYVFQINDDRGGVRWTAQVASGLVAINNGAGAASTNSILYTPILMPVLRFFLRKNWTIGWGNTDAQLAGDVSTWSTTLRKIFV